MSRVICWECGKQLMYVKGSPVFAILVVDGVTHKVHKACAKNDLRQSDTDKRKALHMFTGERIYVETRHYSDGCSATGIAPLPELSPEQQDALRDL